MVFMNNTNKENAAEIVKRLTERNPEFIQHIKDESITLVDFAEIIITQFRAFEGI